MGWLQMLVSRGLQTNRAQSYKPLWMDGWMHGWMDGWMDAWMDGWMDGCVTTSPARCDHVEVMHDLIMSA